jgi:uncharacterized protein with HEPN domain
MRLEAKKYLFDIQQAAIRLAEFTSGQTFETYVADAMLRAAVERQFEIIGEALAQLRKLDHETCGAITDAGRIIAFRNILITAMRTWTTGWSGTSSKPNSPS